MTKAHSYDIELDSYIPKNDKLKMKRKRRHKLQESNISDRMV